MSVILPTRTLQNLFRVDILLQFQFDLRRHLLSSNAAQFETTRVRDLTVRTDILVAQALPLVCPAPC